MHLKSHFISGAILAAATALSISEAAWAGNTKVDMHRHVEFVKPGAAVSMTHNYDGETALGEVKHFTVTLGHLYESGFLTAQLLTPTGLQLMPDHEPVQSRLTSGSKLSLPVQFSSAQAGEYFIGIDIVYESPMGEQSRRVLSVPVIIGTKSSEKTQAKAAPSNSAKGLIIMSAQEVIK